MKSCCLPTFITTLLNPGKTLLCFVFLLFYCSLSSFAQEKQGANWFFGGVGSALIPGTHLDFNNPLVHSQSYFYDYNELEAGVATMSDKNGDLLFFSSHGHVATKEKINNKYQRMPNGNILGNLGAYTCAELIIKKMQNEQVYYIFFIATKNLGFNVLCVAEVDMRLNNGLGDVVPNSIRLLKSNVTQGMAAMMHTNNHDVWLLSGNALGDSLLAFPINSTGIGAPIISKINKQLDHKSLLKSSPNSEKFVSTSKQGIELFIFNRQAGTATALYTLTVPDSAKQRSYSYSFSPNSSKLYVGTESRPGYSYSLYSIFQFDLVSGNVSQIQQSVSTIFRNASQLTNGIRGINSITDMQLAIDGKIYVAREDTAVQYLSIISYPDQVGTACSLKFNSKFLGGGYVYNLPALNQTLFRNAGKLQAQAFRDTICMGDSVKLSAYGAGAERFRWQLANGLTAPSDTLANPIVKPTATTTYRVIASSPFRTDTAFVKVVVLSKSVATLTGPNQVFTFTENQEYKIVGNSQGYGLTWQVTGGEITSGQGTASIKVNWQEAGSGLVEVTETNKQGCIGNKLALSVQISGSPPPVFYNIITPNSDNRNETFTIENLKWYPENHLQIFNRWGKNIYETENYRNDWPQTQIPAGTYYYLFREKTTNQKFKGWLEVVK